MLPRVQDVAVRETIGMPTSVPPFGLAPARLAAAVRALRLPVEFPSWPLLVLAVPIVGRSLLFIAALVVEPWTPDPNYFIPAWAQILQSCAFTALACVLLIYGRGDRRAWSLGLFVLDAAATLLTPFVRAIPAPSLLTWAALYTRTDAFQAAMIWFFASLFPRSAQRRSLAAVFVMSTGAAFALGTALVIAEVVSAFALLDAGSTVGRAAALLARGASQDTDWYFTSQFLSLTPLLVLMPIKFRESGPDDRRRFLWLALGIAVGFLPLVVATLSETVAPLLGLRPWRPPGAVIVASLTAVPVAGAYAALVQRTLDVKLVLRQAFQYVLARAFIGGVALAPFAALTALVVLNRDQPVSALLSGPLGLGLLTLAAAGVIAWTGRGRVLAVLDRRFFREQVDAKTTLLAVSEGVRHAESVEEVRDTLAAAIGSALHPESFVTAVAGADDCLHAIDADVAPLRRGGALAQLAAGGGAALDLTAVDTALLQRVGDRDSAWLRETGAAVLVPLRGSQHELLGLLALGGKQSELRYSRADRELLSAVGDSGGFALDRILTLARNTGAAGVSRVLSPPARECRDCGTIASPDADRCSCGGVLQRAAAPLLLGEHLRFERRIGAGGMGVVYRAMDLGLGLPRAVKTLPSTDPVMMARLRREARLMAAVTHPNVATVYGLELWRDSPMLVMEFMEGGTLSERLRAGPLSLEATMTLGIAVAGGLHALHRTGLLHRDIKPSNIGLAADGTPKLLDFGLAKVAPGESASTTLGRAPDESTMSLSQLTEGDGLKGTPAYLSPEVLEGEAPSIRDDLWSLSVTLLETCTGANPFRAGSVAATVARVLTEPQRAVVAAQHLPSQARALFLTLLGPPAVRPRSAQQLVQVLSGYASIGG
jgi:Protein kinase domain